MAGTVWRPPQEIVYIGQNLPKEAMQAALRDCLLTDKEMALKSQGWKKFADPFPAWLPSEPHAHA